MLLRLTIGFCIGCAVGATGIGGGLLLVPILVSVLRVSPLVAVGTALLFMSGTKLWALMLHVRQKTLDLNLALHLSIGSIPGVLAGAICLALLSRYTAQTVDHILKMLIAVSLSCISLLSFVVEFLASPNSVSDSKPRNESRDKWVAIGIGLLGGFIVCITSVGSGSLIILLLLLFCPRRPAVLVGTDILHAIVLTVIATLVHLKFSPIDVRLALSLFGGAIPGVCVGTDLSFRIQGVWLRRLLLLMALAGGLSML